MSLAALALVFATPLAATTVEPLDVDALAARSDLVARVVVTDAQAARVGRRIVTFYEVDIVDAWLSRDAAAPRRAVVAIPGGVVGGVGQHVAGMPVLEVGGAYVLCLGDDDGPAAPGPGAERARGIVGLWQGAFAVVDAGRLRAFTHGGPPAPLLEESALRRRLGGAR